MAGRARTGWSSLIGGFESAPFSSCGERTGGEGVGLVCTSSCAGELLLHGVA